MNARLQELSASHKSGRQRGIPQKMIRTVNYFRKEFEEWLGGRDSNPDKQSQSLTPHPDSTLFRRAPLLLLRRLVNSDRFQPPWYSSVPIQLSHNQSHMFLARQPAIPDWLMRVNVFAKLIFEEQSIKTMTL